MEWLKRLFWLCVFGAATGAAPLHARFCEDIVGIGEALYWTWTGARPEYAFQTTEITPPNFEVLQMTHDYNPDYQWGFRVGLGWRPRCGPCYAEITYLRLSRDRQVEAFGFAAGFEPQTSVQGNVIATIGNDYENVDLTLGRYVWKGRNLAFHVYGGGRWVYLKETDRIDGPALSGPGHLRGFSKYNAGAFKLGFGGDVRILCLSLIGTVDMLAVIGEQNSNERFEEPDLTVIRPETSSVRINSGLGVKLGVKYVKSWRCVCVSAEAGFEVQTYFDVLRRTLRRTDLAIEISDVQAGYGGPYAGLKIAY